MKCDSKSVAKCARAVFFCAVFLLAACADVRGPQWLTGEPDDSVLNAPRVVGSPSGLKDPSWPNLADVPETKPKFSTEAERAEKSTDLASDNMKAKAEMERIRNIELYGEAERTRTTTQE
ncbi:MAG TPA: hypothetical protein DCY07_05430 [Rhodospirillaceae bacterium]|nr:hypothetical protein [Rhodospirillaceae bacterium]